LDSSSPLDGTETLLVVDDEELILDLLKIALARSGYQVLTSASAQGALTLYEENQQRIALLITDLLMPDADGAELAFQIRQKNPDLPILIATGFLSESEVASLKKAGIQGVVSKPYRTHELLKTIRGLLNGE
jgi:CheY-like chemotaxis protein